MSYEDVESGLTVISLFDGISCGKLALARAGFKVKHYYASEVDKYAIKASKHNNPDIVHIGDVRNISYNNGLLITEVGEYDIGKVDIIIGGSPCQSFSFAGKRKGMSTITNEKVTTLEQYLTLKDGGFQFEGQSYLFWEYMRILNEVSPTYFLLENVRMATEWENILTSAIGVGKIEINSALLSAQNRLRWYWTNIANIQQPQDKHLVLKDIIEDNAVVDRDKAYCIDANYYKGSNWEQYKTKHRRQLVAVGAGIRGRYLDENGRRLDSTVDSQVGLTEQRIELRNDGKSNCLTTVQKDSLVAFVSNDTNKNFIPIDNHHSLYGLKCIGGFSDNQKWLDDGKNLQRNFSQGERVYDIDGKSPTLSAQGGGTAGASVIIGEVHNLHEDEDNRTVNRCIQVGNTKESKRNSITTRGYSIEGKSPTLTTCSTVGQQEKKITDDSVTWRKLTVTECCRLQTLPDNYFNGVISNSQAYKCIGNGWTVDVIAHIFSYMYKYPPIECNPTKPIFQGALF